MLPEKLQKWLINNPNMFFKNGIFYGPCPIHSGADNPTGFSVSATKNLWACWTNGCHQTHGNKITDLCRLLDLDSFGWVAPPFTKPQRVQNEICSLEEYKERFTIPCEYALSRGYSKYTLKKYSVGNPLKRGKLYNRCCLPILTDNGRNVVGVTGRSLTGKMPKWFHYNFSSSSNLFNLWYAKTSITKSRTAILVEGPFDVLSIVEAGVSNVVAVFGLQLSYIQSKILKRLGVENIILAFDNDEAGEVGCQNIICRANNDFEFTRVKPPSKDWGETPPEQIRHCLS